MEPIFLMFAGAAALLLIKAVRHGSGSNGRSDFITHYRFPGKIKAAVLERYPHLSGQQADQVIEGLREYCHVCNKAGKEFVSMPSEVVDTAWHEFILFTREYQRFCDKAFGRFLHHTPAEGVSNAKQAQKGIRTAWRHSCARERIDLKKPVKLPFLFAIDADLAIEDGFVYELDCTKSGQLNAKKTHCASHIATCHAAGCGGGLASGCADGGADAGCGGGCGG